jgi:hypothetical protein
MTAFDALLRVLSEHGVEFILIGGAAAIAHGSARFTEDLDVVYERSPENLMRIVDALAPYQPYPRGAPAGIYLERSRAVELTRSLPAGLSRLNSLACVAFA